MGYIDRKSLFDHMGKYQAENKDDHDVDWNDAVSLIGSEPEVDVVPVVRCKDCKHAGYCDFDKFPDGYCSDGERKETMTGNYETLMMALKCIAGELGENIPCRIGLCPYYTEESEFPNGDFPNCDLEKIAKSAIEQINGGRDADADQR